MVSVNSEETPSFVDISEKEGVLVEGKMSFHTDDDEEMDIDIADAMGVYFTYYRDCGSDES
jgi:hypothetical protein